MTDAPGLLLRSIALRLFLVSPLALAACGVPASQQADDKGETSLANPASENCLAKGGKIFVETDGSGGQYGVCLFEDNRQCEEWALLRGDCPEGGLKITGYPTAAARYCAIRGGSYSVTAEAAGEQPERGACKLADGTTCDAEAYFNGSCPKS